MTSDSIEVYLKVLNHQLPSFPRGFFSEDTHNEAIREIVRYFTKHLLNLQSRQDILLKIRKESFQKYKLGGLLKAEYRNSPSEAMIDSFPELCMQPWEFHECQNNYWKGEEGVKNAIKAFQTVYYDRLGLKNNEIIANLTYEVLEREGLLGAIKHGFNDNLRICAEKCFPGLAHPWEVGGHVGNNYWTREKGAKALRKVLDQYTREEIVKKYSRAFFIEHKLYGMLQKYFNDNLFESLDAVYPGEFKPWELKRVRTDYWTDETVREALHWVIETKGLTLDEAMNLSRQEFADMGMYGAMIYSGKGPRSLFSEYSLEFS